MAYLLRIGLTGGIASGKSTVARRFWELGVPVIDADEAARAVVMPGTAGFTAVVEHFGKNFIATTGELDRRALRELIFSDLTQRQHLESLLHPLIEASMEQQASAAIGPYLVMTLPLLVEGNLRYRVNRVLVVDVDEAAQIERLIARDDSSREQACAILASQASRTARLNAADDVLTNAASITELRRSVDRLHERYLQLAASMPPSPI